jgi:hypothetical protein
MYQCTNGHQRSIARGFCGCSGSRADLGTLVTQKKQKIAKF